MGAWGYSALDNDSAYDILYLWEEWTQKCSYTSEQATQKFIQDWGDAINYGDSLTNMEIIALLAILLNNGAAISEQFKKISVDAINREIIDEALDSWNDPDKRKVTLISLLKEVDGEIKKPIKPKFFKDPALCYRNTNIALNDLNRLTKRIRKAKPGYYNINKEPSFIKTLRRLMNSQVWEKDINIYGQARRERLMMISWYLGTELKMSEEEIRALLERSAKWPPP